jgi:hypothetical protein
MHASHEEASEPSNPQQALLTAPALVFLQVPAAAAGGQALLRQRDRFVPLPQQDAQGQQQRDSTPSGAAAADVAARAASDQLDILTEVWPLSKAQRLSPSPAIFEDLEGLEELNPRGRITCMCTAGACVVADESTPPAAALISSAVLLGHMHTWSASVQALSPWNHLWSQHVQPADPRCAASHQRCPLLHINCLNDLAT